jgi:glucose-6-phosphate isomerase
MLAVQLQGKCICGSLGLQPTSSLFIVNSKELEALRIQAKSEHSVRDLFVREPHRAEEFTIDACGIHADFSRQLMSSDLLTAMRSLVEAEGIPALFAEMASGAVVNTTENRRVLHTALRDDAGKNEWAAKAAVQRERAAAFADQVRGDAHIDAVINIGIGGSDLGPAMATRALRRSHDGPVVRFVSNIDAADFDDAIRGLDASRTLVIVSSKTFTTIETMHNAERARAWVSACGVDWRTRFAAATAQPSEALAWGIPPERIFEFFDWVGGRFSLSSVIGLPLMCAIGTDSFNEMLRGMHEMDMHMGSAAIAENLPITHALTWFLNAVLLQLPTVAVIPYSHDLGRLPAFLQQLVMESNGKGVARDGQDLIVGTSPVVWGEPGTNGQHAFFQMLHQGTQIVPVEFISTVEPLGDDAVAHDVLIANMVAQAEAFAAGSESDDPQRRFAGARPNTVLLLDRLDPHSLGALISMYEHSTVVQGWLMGVNSFDQFGVELGKSMAKVAVNAIEDGAADTSQTMTHPLMEWFLRRRQNKS